MTTVEEIFRAIKIINPNAEMSMSENNLDTLVWENGTTPISVADIEKKLPQAKQELTDEKQAKIDLKVSAKTKLMNGEALTEDEANVMVGL